jgi:IS605 OrfB family transposase
MQLVEKHIISKGHPLFTEIDEKAFLSKNLYNAGLYAIRQHFFNTGNFLNYAALQKVFQDSKQHDYVQLPAKVSQWVLKGLCTNFESFFKSVKAYSKNPKKFKACPKIPKYKHKVKGRNLLCYTIQAIHKAPLREQKIQLSGTNIVFPTKTKPTYQRKTAISSEKSNIAQVRIVPKATCYVIEVVYERKVKSGKDLNRQYIAGIDLGLNNLAAVTSNKQGFAPFLVNGRPLKSINQYFNKQKAHLQSLLPKGQFSSKKIQKLTHKRNCKIDDYLHKASRIIINELVKQRIGTLVIGKNEGWKDSINLGRQNNQNFVAVPHARFIEMLIYKAELEGMKVKVNEESYTSKCSFLDKEPIKKHRKYKGKRAKRGLFVSAKGIKINADINASLNIIRKVAPKAFVDGVEGVVVHPNGYFSIK